MCHQNCCLFLDYLDKVIQYLEVKCWCYQSPPRLPLVPVAKDNVLLLMQVAVVIFLGVPSCLSVCLPTCLPVCMWYVCLSVCLSACLPVCPVNLYSAKKQT